MDPVFLPLASLARLSTGHSVFGRLTQFAENLVALLPLLAMSLALGAFIVFILISRRTIYLMLFVLALTAGMYLINPHLRTYSYHGMIHLGYVYATERLPWPPEDPYLAGTPLYYPWAYHALVAGISSVLAVAPSWVFVACNLAALAVTVVVVAAISRQLDGDEITAKFAVIIAILAPTFLGAGAVVVFDPLIPSAIDPALMVAFWFESALPTLSKYFNVTPMPLGMAAGLIGFHQMLKIVEVNKSITNNILVIILMLIFLGYIYPFLWLSACIMVVVVAAVAVRAGAWQKALALAVALLLGSLVAAPYLLVLTAGRAPGHGIGLERNPRICLAHLLHVTIVLLPLWLLIALRRRSLIERLRAKSWAHWATLGSSLALLLTFIFLNVRTADVGVGYKFRVMAVLCLAPLAAPGLKRIQDWNRSALVLVLALQLLPLCFECYMKSPLRWGSVAEPYYWQGTVIRHGNREQDQLYQWIREHTPATAILIDNKPYDPVYAQRSLFVARQSHWKAEDWSRQRDGWLFHPTQWLTLVNGHPSGEIRRRNRLVDALYSQSDTRSGENLVRQLDKMTENRPVFVVARNERQKAVLESRPFLRKVAEASSWAVYAREKDQNPG